MIGSEQHFRTSFGSDRAAILLTAIKTAVGKAQVLTAAHGFVESLTEPVIAFDFVVSGLADFELLDGIRRETVKKQHLWIVDDTYALRVKKLRPGYRSANHSSKQQSRINQSLPLDGLGPMVYLTAGAVYSDITGLVGEWVVVKHIPTTSSIRSVEWVVDLMDLAAGETDPRTPILPLPGTPDAPAIVIPRRDFEPAKEASE